MRWLFPEKKPKKNLTVNVEVDVQNMAKVKQHVKNLEQKIESLIMLNKRKDKDIREYKRVEYKELASIAKIVSNTSVHSALDIYNVMDRYIRHDREMRRKGL